MLGVFDLHFLLNAHVQVFQLSETFQKWKFTVQYKYKYISGSKQNKHLWHMIYMVL